MDKISAVIITYNEEKNIRRCLNSLIGVADEIIVLDSYSSDKTKTICEEFEVKFIESAWKGYSQSKNIANAHASNAYILSVDADEELSEALKESILKAKERGLNGAYSFNRLSNYMGRWIRHGDWYPDRKMRIWNKNEGSWKGEIHEKVEFPVNVSIKHLKGDLNHYSYYSISEHIEQINKYSTLSAEELYRKKKKVGFIKIILSPWSQFFTSFVIKLGFLDGYKGFAISLITSFGSYLKYAKLRAKY